jgi:hypothetical protein
MRLCDFQKSGEPVNLVVAYSALTTDVITEYAFSRSYKFLERKYFAPEWWDMMMAATQVCHVNKQFPWLMPLVKALPVWVVKKTNPIMMGMLNFQKVRCFNILSESRSITVRGHGRSTPF